MSYSLKVITIDDGNIVHQITVSFIKRLCKKLNVSFELTEFNDSIQGLFELSNNGDSYDMILMGIKVLPITGDEVYNSLLHNNPELTKRITFITGYPDILYKRFPNESFHIIPKPFRYHDFCALLLPAVVKAKDRQPS